MKYAKTAAGVLFAGLSLGFLYALNAPLSESAVRRVLGDLECKTIFVDVDFGPEYRGALIDTHIHIPNDTRDLRNLICTLANEGTKKTFAFFPIFSLDEDDRFAVARVATETHPGLFVPFIMPPDRDDRPDGFPTVSGDVLKRMLEKTPGLFVGYGEIGLYERGDHGGPAGAPALPPDSPRMRAVYPIVREHDLLVYVHLGEGQQASFERAARENRDIDYLFHGDQLVVYRDGTQDLSALDEILYRNPNVYYGVDELYGDTWLLRPEISKEEFLAHFDDYEDLLKKDLATWKGFIERHPNQVLWGTDRGWFGSWPTDPDVGLYLTRYARAFINRLDPAVQERFAYKNAERLHESHQ